ncbi:MAG: hypothetical protein SNF33_06635 [Candidatus Algichlamydia australiensis]|nr:hypothetical protein [Chlamydiales bacterium]
MWRAIIKGSIVGALVAFAWSFFSWVVLPWHENTVHQFQNEEYVSWALKENTKKHGIYVYPSCSEKEGMTKAERNASWKDYQEKVEKGPYVFASVVPKGFKFNMLLSQLQMIVALLIAAGIISFLLLKSQFTTYFGKVFFVTLIALVAGILVDSINWIWWQFPTHFTAVNMIDQVITWFIAGLAMAPVVKIKHQRG